MQFQKRFEITERDDVLQTHSFSQNSHYRSILLTRTRLVNICYCDSGDTGKE